MTSSLLSSLMPPHETFIKRANKLALQAAQKGNHPFGAVLVHNNKIIAEAENTVNTDDDFTRHAELNLVAAARKDYSQEVLSESILYASTAPCLRCAAAIWSAGIRSVVYGVRYETLSSRVPDTYRYVSVEEAYKLLKTPLYAIGGVLEEQCLESYKLWHKEEK
jgi:tRNA(Arg) A34 adenosine deaminase TadA